MNELKSVHIHPEVGSELPPTGIETHQFKPSRIPLPNYTAWTNGNPKSLGTRMSMFKKRPNTNNISAPTSPRDRSQTPSPHASPTHSSASEKSTPTQKHHAIDKCRSLSLIPQRSRIPISTKNRYNMLTAESNTSLPESTTSSEFLSTVCLVGSPDHDDEEASDKTIADSLVISCDMNRHSSKSPSMLYPLDLSHPTTATIKTDEEDNFLDPNNKEDGESTRSFSTISIPSKVSIASGKDDEYSSSNSLKSSQYELNAEDLSNIKLSADYSQLFEEKVDLLSEDNITVLRTLEEARSSIEFLEAENQTLMDKSQSDTLEISELKLTIVQFEEQADKFKIAEKLALENHDKNELQKQVLELTKQKADLQDKLSATEKEHSLCNQQIKIASSSKNDTEKQLLNLKADLLSSHDTVKNLQETVKYLQNERNGHRSSLDKEEIHVGDLQSSLDSTTVSLANMMKQVETLHDEKENLTKAFQKREEDIEALNEDLKQIKQEKAAIVARLQSSLSEKECLADDLEQTKQSLSQAREQHKTSQLKVREIGQELSVAKCEAKEMAAITNTEAKESKMTSKENQELKNRIRNLEEDLASKEREVTSLRLEQQSNKARIIDLDETLKKEETSQTQEIPQLVSEIAELKSKNRQLKETKEEMEGAIRNLELQHTALQCSLESEREQKNTLALKATTLEKDVLSFRDQYQKHNNHNHELKEITEQKFLSSKEVEDSLRNQVQSNVDSLKQKEDELRSTVIKLKQVETELEKAKTKTVEYETQVTLLMADVENHKRLCDNLQSKLQLIQDSKSQEMYELNAQLGSKRSEIVNLSARLDSVFMEKQNIEQSLDKSTEALEQEKIVLASVQLELATAENNGTELASHLSNLEEHIKSLTLLNDNQKQQLEDGEIKIVHQTKELELLQEKLNAGVVDEGEQKQIQNDEKRQQMQKEMEKIIQERDNSEASFQKTSELLTQEKLATSQRNLEKVQLELNKQQQQFNSLCLSMETETASHDELAKKYTILEAQHEQSCQLIQDLSSKLTVTNEESDEIREKLKESEHHCSTLQRDVTMIEEAKTIKEKRMEEKLVKVITQYEEEVLNSKQSNNTLQASNGKLSVEASHCKVHSSTLQKKLENEITLNEQLQTRIPEDKARHMLQGKTISELEVQLADEAASKVAVKRELAAILSKEQDLQLKFDELQNKLCSAMINGDNLERKLEEEKWKTTSQQEEIKKTEIELKMKRSALFKGKEQRTDLKFKLDSEITQLRHKYQTEVKAHREKNKDLQTELQLSKSAYVTKTIANDKLQASCDDLKRTHDILQFRIEKKQRQFEENFELLKSYEIRNQNLEIHITQLQLEVTTLAKSQLEFEDYKRKIESSSREELQRVLKEVTEHMEEQHTAHHYLEKLRKENESIALKEKDHQIDHLKTQVKRKKQELKKDRLRIESLEIESRFLKSQHLDNTNIRHKIESHLGMISDTLGISTAGSTTAPQADSSTVHTITDRSSKSFQ